MEQKDLGKEIFSFFPTNPYVSVALGEATQRADSDTWSSDPKHEQKDK